MTAPGTAEGNEEQIVAYYQAKGLNPIEIAGILGNDQVESGFDPNAYNAAENAHGISQWEGGRWSGPQGLESFAAANNSSPFDLNTQLDFQWWEGNQRGDFAQLAKASTPQQAAQIWSTSYEGNTPASIPARQADAVSAYQSIQTGSFGQSSYGTAGAQPASFQTAGFEQASYPLGPLDPLNWPGELGGLAGSAAGAVASQVEKWLTAIAKPIIDFGADVLLVVFGLIFVIVGLRILAEDPPSFSTAPPDKGGSDGDDDQGEEEGSEGGAHPGFGTRAEGEGGVAEDAAVA